MQKKEKIKELIFILNKHRGIKNSISADNLASLLNISERTLRSHINEIITSNESIPIGCSTIRNKTGYFIIKTKEEAKNQYNMFHQRAETSKAKANKIRNLVTKGIFN